MDGAKLLSQIADASQFGDASSQSLGERGGGMGHNNQHEAVQLLWITILHLLLCFVVSVGGGGREGPLCRERERLEE